jgi:hypothetical protein
LLQSVAYAAMGRVLRIVAPTIDRKPKHGQRNLKGLRLAIPDTDAVEQVEQSKPRMASDDAGAETIAVSPISVGGMTRAHGNWRLPLVSSCYA